MVRGRMFSGSDELSLVKAIQETVFVEELNMPADAGMDNGLCMHAVAFSEEDVCCATGKIMFDGDDFIIGGVAVLPEYRNKLYGDFIVRLLVDKAMMSNAAIILADVLEGTEKLFENIGFMATGEVREDFGKKWISMKLDVSNIHKCCNCR